MADYDIVNDGYNKGNLNVKGGLPSIDALRTAIAGSTVASSYPTATLEGATKNDLIHICRTHGIAVAGLILPTEDETQGHIPIISLQPANTSAADAANATFTVSAYGSAPLSYQWQRQVHGAGAWANVGGATAATYVRVAATADSTDKFRVVVTNRKGSVTSSAATLTVT